MKVLAILLACLWHSLDGKGAGSTAKVPPPSSALQKVTNDLSILSRLANGIALQKEFNAKTIKVNVLLAELLGMDPNDNGIDSLLKIDLNKVPDDYAEIANQASSIKPSPLNASIVNNWLQILGVMGGDVNALKEGAKVNLTDILNVATIAYSADLAIFANTFQEYARNFNTTFKLEGKGIDVNKLTNSFYHLKNKFVDFQSQLEKIINYENELNDMWKIIGKSEKVESVGKIANISETYNANFGEIKALDANLKQLSTEFTSLDPFLKKFSIMKSVAEKLNLLKKALQKLSSSKVSNRLLTAGFPRGISDINRLFIDLKSEWLKEKIAKNNETALNEMINDLDGLKRFNQKATQYEKSWNTVKASDSMKNLQKLSELWDLAVEKELTTSATQQLQQSTSGIGECFKELNPITVNVEFVKFNVLLKKLQYMDGISAEVKDLFGQIAKIDILRNETVLEYFKINITSVSDDTLNIMDLSPLLNELKRTKEYQDLLEGIMKACEIMDKIEKTGLKLELSKRLKEWNAITRMQNVLNDTKLVDSLDCLMKNKFDDVGISKVLNFGSTIRLLGNFHKSDGKSLISFIKQAIHLKSSHANVTIPSSKSRSKRSTSSFDSLDNALVLSQDLGKGVNLLQKMVDVYNKKNTLMEVANYKKEVFLEMKKVLNTIDTSSFPSDLSKTAKDLDNLEEYAKKNSDGDLQNIGGIFEQASTIPGVSIESKQLNDPISTSFRNSPNENVKKAAPSFKVLGSLQLDYSNHRSDFKTSSLGVIKLKDYFDSFFMVPSPDSQSGSKDGGPKIPWDYVYGGGTTVFILILAVIIALILRYVAKIIKADNLDTYRHLFFAGGDEEKKVDFDEGYYFMSIHYAIYNNYWNPFKNSVDIGANVNAYGQILSYWGTALHFAISYGKENTLKYVKYLLKNGADMNMLDTTYKTPLQLVTASEQPDKKLIKLFEKYQKKKFYRRLPPKFPAKNYRVEISGYECLYNEGEIDEFTEKYNGQVVQVSRHATHIVFPTLEDGSVVLDLSDSMVRDLLPHFFGPKMIMKPTWLKACLKSRKNFENDFKFRLESVTINGVKYDNVIKIHRSIVERRIPFLHSIDAYFIDDISEYLAIPLARTVKALGGVPHKYGCYPLENDAQFCQTGYRSRKPRFHFRDDFGPIFVFTNNKEELIRDCGFLLKNNTYTIIEPYAFLELIFKFEARHHELPGHAPDTKTLEIQGIESRPEDKFERKGNVKDDEWLFN